MAFPKRNLFWGKGILIWSEKKQTWQGELNLGKPWPNVITAQNAKSEGFRQVLLDFLVFSAERYFFPAIIFAQECNFFNVSVATSYLKCWEWLSICLVKKNKRWPFFGWESILMGNMTDSREKKWQNSLIATKLAQYRLNLFTKFQKIRNINEMKCAFVTIKTHQKRRICVTCLITVTTTG